MTLVRYEGGLNKEAKLRAREWLLTQDISLVEKVVVRPASMAFTFTWGLRLKVSVVGAGVDIFEISPCCAATLGAPSSQAHFYCKSCMKVVRPLEGQLQPFTFCLSHVRQCPTPDQVEESLARLDFETVAEKLGLDPLSAVVAISATASLLAGAPQVFGYTDHSAASFQAV